jgi:hypothetical protein
MSDRTKAVKKLDTVFSKFVRQRDMENGYGKCCSCKKLIEAGDAGHFINRRWYSTRWHEQNVHLQCLSCNRFQEGNAAGYALFMLDKYGKEHVEYLQALSREPARYSLSDINLMIADYRQRLKHA